MIMLKHNLPLLPLPTDENPAKGYEKINVCPNRRQTVGWASPPYGDFGESEGGERSLSGSFQNGRNSTGSSGPLEE